MNCKECGRVIPALTKICGYCGTRQGDAVIMHVPLTPAPEPAKAAKPKKKVKQ